MQLLLQSHVLHDFDVVIAAVSHGIGNLAGAEGAYKVVYRISNRVEGLKPQFVFDLLGRDVVGAIVVGGCDGNLDIFSHLSLHHTGNLVDLVVVITSVEYLPADGSIRPSQ